MIKHHIHIASSISASIPQFNRKEHLYLKPASVFPVFLESAPCKRSSLVPYAEFILYPFLHIISVNFNVVFKNYKEDNYMIINRGYEAIQEIGTKKVGLEGLIKTAEKWRQNGKTILFPDTRHFH